jgi:hypothetical protein
MTPDHLTHQPRAAQPGLLKDPTHFSSTFCQDALRKTSRRPFPSGVLHLLTISKVPLFLFLPFNIVELNSDIPVVSILFSLSPSLFAFSCSWTARHHGAIPNPCRRPSKPVGLCLCSSSAKHAFGEDTTSFRYRDNDKCRSGYSPMCPRCERTSTILFRRPKW